MKADLVPSALLDRCRNLGRERDGKQNKIVNVGNVAPDLQLPALIEGVIRHFRLSEYSVQKHVAI